MTYGETKLLLLFDQVKSNHEMRELEEMKAHDVALMMINHEAKEKEKPLTERFIKELNHTILVQDFWKEAITPDRQNTRRKIKVGNYKEYPNSVELPNGEIFEYASPQETPILMSDLIQWYNEEVEKKEFSPIQLAALLHYRFIRIHPFDDGNGRVARLLVNYVLFYHDLPPVIIKTEDKKNYLRALQQADAGDLNAFIDYMINQLAWSVDISIRAAKGEDIEEQNDWEKQLALLKKSVGDSNSSVLKKTKETLNNVIINTIKPLCSLLDNKLILFNSLFLYSESIIKYDSIERTDDNLRKIIDILSESNTNFYSISIYFRFRAFRFPYTNTIIYSIPLTFIFDINAYLIAYNNNTTSKLYSEQLSESEMNDIVSDVAKDLLIKIESLKKNR